MVGVGVHKGVEDGHIILLSSTVKFVSALASQHRDKKKKIGTRPDMFGKE